MKWKTIKLNEVMTQRKGSVLIDDDKEYKRCRIQLHRRGVLLRDVVPGKDIRTKKQQVCRAGDFIVAEMDAKFGGYGFIGEELEGAIVSSHYYLYDIDKKKFLPEYFSVLIASDTIQSQIKAKGSTNYSSIRGHEVLDFEIPLPDIKDQKKIAAYYFDCMRQAEPLLNELASQRQHLAHLRQSLLQEAVTGRLTAAWRKKRGAGESGHDLLQRIRKEKERLVKEKKIKKEHPLPPIKPEEIPFEIPENWAWCRFGETVSIESNLVSPFDFPNLPHVAPDNIEKHTGVLLPCKTVREDDVISANHYFFAGQLVYSKVRPKLNKVVLVDFDGLCSADMYPLKPYFNPAFLKWCMLSSYFLAEVDKFDNRVKMPKINQKQLTQIPLPIPSSSEQEEIVRQVEELLGCCEELEREIERNEERAAMLQQSILRDVFEQGATSTVKPLRHSEPASGSGAYAPHTRKEKYVVSLFLSLVDRIGKVDADMLEGVFRLFERPDECRNFLDVADRSRFDGIKVNYNDFFNTISGDRNSISWELLRDNCVARKALKSTIENSVEYYSKGKEFEAIRKEYVSFDLGKLVEFGLKAYRQESCDTEPIKQTTTGKGVKGRTQFASTR